MTRARGFLTATALVVAVLASVSLANAAGLTLTSGAVTSQAVTHPCTGTASAFPTNHQTGGNNFRSVLLAVPAGCELDPVQVAVIRPNNNAARYGTGTTDANGRATVAMNDNYDVTQANTLLGTAAGWALPTSWAHVWCSVIGSTTATCTATVTIFTGVKPGGGSATYYDVVVTTTSTAYVQWEVGFYLNQPFYGTQPTRVGNSTLDSYNDGETAWNGTTNNVTRQSECAAIPVLFVRGNNNGGTNNFQNVKSDRERRFSLVLNINQQGYYDVVALNCN